MQYEVRAMSFGEILDTGFRIVRNNFVQLVAIAAIVNVPLAFLRGAGTDMRDGIGTPSAAGIVIAGLGFVVLSPFVTIAITYAIGENYQGRTTTIGRAFREGLAIVLPMVGTTLIGGLLIAVGLLLLVIPGVWLMLGQIVLSQVMIFERRFGTNGLRRSLDLMNGHRLRGLGISLLAAILIGFLGVALSLVARLVPYAGPLASGLASAVGTTFFTAVAVVLYFDIRCRKEGFEIEHLARLVRAGATPQPVA